jgi:hypothetical protein
MVAILFASPGLTGETKARETGWGGRDWIDLAQDGDQWRALVNIIMNI